MWGTWVRSLGQEDFLEKEMSTHFSTLAQKIPWMEEPGASQCPWGRRESDKTERLHFHFHFSVSKSFAYVDSINNRLKIFQRKQKKSEWLSKNKTLIYHSPTTIYIVFTLYLQLLTQHLHCIKYYKQSRGDMHVMCKQYAILCK